MVCVYICTAAQYSTDSRIHVCHNLPSVHAFFRTRVPSRKNACYQLMAKSQHDLVRPRSGIAQYSLLKTVALLPFSSVYIHDTDQRLLTAQEVSHKQQVFQMQHLTQHHVSYLVHHMCAVLSTCRRWCIWPPCGHAKLAIIHAHTG